MERVGERAMIDLNVPAPEMEVVQEPVIQWPIKKVLTKSDADPNVCWLRLPVQQVRNHILPYLPPQKMDILERENPVLINVINDDIVKAYRIKFKFRRASSTYMLQETRPLIMEGTLLPGQEIKFRWVEAEGGQEGALHFSVLP